jgi:acyl carrier protein
VPEVRAGRCCAFSIDREEGEALVIVAELERTQRHNFDAATVFTRLREEISVQHEAELFDAVFVRTGTFPLTSSGKAQRARARQEYLEGKLQVVAQIRTPEPRADEQYFGRVAEIRAKVIGYVADHLHVSAENVSTEQSFQRLGLDSLSLVEMVLDLEEFTGQSLEASIVLEYSCIEELSANIARVQLASQPAPPQKSKFSVG